VCDKTILPVTFLTVEREKERRLFGVFSLCVLRNKIMNPAVIWLDGYNFILLFALEGQTSPPAPLQRRGVTNPEERSDNCTDNEMSSAPLSFGEGLGVRSECLVIKTI
jgi:hypothetical protein